MIDTHTHLQFKAFEGKTAQVIKGAREAGVDKIIIVGTNLETSKKAIELAQKHPGLYASIGLHPHHIFSLCHSERSEESIENNKQIPRKLGMTKTIIDQLEPLLKSSKAVAVGETGLDKHLYSKTQYQNYAITDKFMELQKLFFKEQIKLAIKYQKSLIIHNRKAVPELLEILETNWDPFLEHRSVFHCSEPDHRLLEFATLHNIYIGIDGDITYDKGKQEFMKKIPLELLVLETDSPYFVPEPLKSAGVTLNEPKNLKYIAETIARLKNEPIENVREMSSRNSTILFKL